MPTAILILSAKSAVELEDARCDGVKLGSGVTRPHATKCMVRCATSATQRNKLEVCNRGGTRVQARFA